MNKFILICMLKLKEVFVNENTFYSPKIHLIILNKNRINKRIIILR
jgi:fumarate reductase subunit C